MAISYSKTTRKFVLIGVEHLAIQSCREKEAERFYKYILRKIQTCIHVL